MPRPLCAACDGCWKGVVEKMRKKYGWLFGLTLAAIAGILMGGRLMKKPPVEVSVITLEPQLVEQTVSCSGKVEAAKSQNVYLDMRCVAKDVYVQAGQKVNRGDVLFTVDVNATRQVLAQAGGLAASQIDEEMITKEVTATASGVISSLNVTSGSLADTSKPCAVIASSDQMQVKIAVREQDLQKVAIGQSVTITGSGFRKSAYTGILTELSASARQQLVGTVTDTVVDAVVMFDQDQMDASLRAGLNAKAAVRVSSIPEALVLPYECVMQDEEGSEYVYAFSDGHAVRRDIVSGEEWSAGFHVVSGLQAGDQVILDPDKVPHDGAAVIPGGAAS